MAEAFFIVLPWLNPANADPIRRFLCSPFLLKLPIHMQYLLCDVYAWCLMCQFFFVRSWLFESRRDQKYPNLGSFWPFESYFKVDPRWQSYVHLILQGLMYILNCIFCMTIFFWIGPLETIQIHFHSVVCPLGTQGITWTTTFAGKQFARIWRNANNTIFFRKSVFSIFRF